MKKVISMNLINVIQMKTQSFWLTALLVLLGVFSTVNTNAAEKLMAGTGKVNITPPNPRYPVHDSLYARTLILEAGASRIAFVSLDLVMYSNVPLAEKLKKQFGLQEVYFCPQHTHSGEAGPKEWLDAQITKALKQASSSMFEARISAGYRSFPQLSFNRLLLREDGRARESWVGDDHYRAVNPERIPHGPVDNSVGVIKLEDTKGNPKVILMNYACHPDVAWNNFEISADYVGYATKYTEEAFNNQVYCLFVQGGAGNQAPLFKDGGRTGPDDPRPSNYDLIDRMGKLLSIEAVKLAKEKGTFGAYEGSDWSRGIILGHDQIWFNKNAKYPEAWNELFADLQKYGIRNSQIAAIAPNTSSSLIQGCSASVLPVYSKFFVETHGKGSIPNCPPYIRDKFWFYQENRNISQETVVDIMARINKWIDTGISIELMYNLNRNIRAKDIYNTIMSAWKKDIKTLYYTRTIQKDGSSLEKTECVSCAG